MQHRRGAQPSLQRLVVQSELRKGLPAELDQQIVGLTLVRADQRTQLGRQGKGDQVVIDRQQLGSLPLEPLLHRLVLALGTSAMAAREQERILMAARVAMDGRRAARLGAALKDRRQGIALPREQPLAVLRLQLRQKGCRHLGQADHAASFQRRTKDASNWSWRSRAWALVTSVRWA